MTDQPEKKSLRKVLAERYERFGHTTPRIHWKRWLGVTAILVIIAAITRDTALTLDARTLPFWVKELALNTTDIGNSGWILVSTAIICAASIWTLKKATKNAHLENAYYWAVSASYVFFSVAMSGILANLVKRAIGRGRPRVFDEYGAFHFEHFAGTSTFESFPSGHSTTDGALAMALSILFPRYRLPILIVGFGFAITRILVGAHYLSDVIAGYSFGTWFAYFAAIIFARYGFKPVAKF